MDDHPLMLDALNRVLQHQPNFTIVGEASTGEMAVKSALESKPTVVVMDNHLPAMSGIEATRQILNALPATKILVFSGDASSTRVVESLQVGACGYFLKRGTVEELILAIEDVLAGKLYLSPELSKAIAADHQKNPVSKGRPVKLALSEREKRLLRLITGGARNKEIARELNVNPHSIETYRTRLMKKLLCRGTADLVRYAIREGIAPL